MEVYFVTVKSLVLQNFIEFKYAYTRWKSLVGCSPWGRTELDTTERLHFPFSLSCTGEGNGNPLQCSCLENPRDGEPGGLPSVGLQSRTRLKRLSSSSSTQGRICISLIIK